MVAGKTTMMAGILASLCGCFYTASRGQQLEARVDKLESDDKDTSDKLTQEKADLQRQLPALEAAIQDLQGRLDKLDHASRTSDADVGVQMEAVREDLAKLHGSVEEYQHRLDQLDQQQKAQQDETNGKIAALKGPDALRAYEASKKAAQITRPTDKNEYLKLADTQLASGNTDVAIQLYNEFLQKWPRDPLTPNVDFGLGKGYQSESRWRDALGAYGDVIKKYQTSDKYCGALLNSSDCFAGLGMKEESKVALEELFKDCPKSPEAAKAKTRKKKH
jgi:TolA-binding protein